MKLNLMTRNNFLFGIALASTLGTRPYDAMSINSETRIAQPVTLVVVEKKEPLPPSLPEDSRFIARCFVIRPEEDSLAETFVSNKKREDSFGRPPKQIGNRKKGFKKPFSRRH